VVLLTLSIVYQTFIGYLFPREAEINLLPLDILEDGSVLALEAISTYPRLYRLPIHMVASGRT
jgi:hypothetical protein